MHEICKSCGTVFDLDKTVLSNKIQWLKCSVCNETWNLTSNEKINLNENQKELSPNKEKFRNNINNENEKVRSELASIKSVVENKTKDLSNKNNIVLDIKNKSVAEIASELTASKLTPKNTRKLKSKEKDIIYQNKNYRKVSVLPFVFIFLMLFFCLMIYFRSIVFGYGFFYFPDYTKNYSSNVIEFFKRIKLPVLAELNHINMTNFVATFQKNEVKFSGIIKNDTSRPVLIPRISVLVVREDRKILLEKVIIIEDKIIMPFSIIKFEDFVKVKFSEENVSVKATMLKSF